MRARSRGIFPKAKDESPGQGVPQDYGEAAKWYRLAAEQGNPTAQSNLGSMYYSGQGVPQDYVQAYMWVDLAASRFPPSAIDDRNGAAHNRDIVASKMTAEQLAEAQKLAREWKPKRPARYSLAASGLKEGNADGQ